MRKKVTIDDIVELNERLGEQKGYEINGSSGMCGFDFNLDFAKDMAQIMTEILSDKDRSTPKFTKNKNFTGGF